MPHRIYMSAEVNHTVCLRLLLLLLLVSPGAIASAQSVPSRLEVAEALRETGSQRLHISLVEKTRLNYRVNEEDELIPLAGSDAGKENTYYRKSDGSGRYLFRQIRRIEREDGTPYKREEGTPARSEEVVYWNGRELRSTYRDPDSEPGSPVDMGITDVVPMYHMNDDDIWPVLGVYLDYPVSDRSPLTRIADAVADKNSPVEITRIVEDGRELIQIELLDPWGTGGRGPEFIYKFDPQRDWIMVESLKNNPARTSERYGNRYSKRITVTRIEQIGGEWVPIEAELEHFDYREGPDKRPAPSYPLRYPVTITFSEINVDPEISDEDFTIDVADLPEGSSIVDSRLGISYKLGENLIYMDGHLNRVGRPITDEITPKELKELMADAEPLIDPELVKLEAELKPVAPKGLWTNRTAYALGMIGLGVGVLGIYLFWRKQHAA